MNESSSVAAKHKKAPKSDKPPRAHKSTENHINLSDYLTLLDMISKYELTKWHTKEIWKLCRCHFKFIKNQNGKYIKKFMKLMKFLILVLVLHIPVFYVPINVQCHTSLSYVVVVAIKEHTWSKCQAVLCFMPSHVHDDFMKYILSINLYYGTPWSVYFSGFKGLQVDLDWRTRIVV